MHSIYGTAWKILEERIAKTRRQSISKADLIEWQLKSLEQAVDEWGRPSIVTSFPPEEPLGQQEKA